MSAGMLGLGVLSPFGFRVDGWKETLKLNRDEKLQYMYVCIYLAQSGKVEK